MLAYDLKVRKHALRLVMKNGTKLNNALLKSARDPVIKERYFTTPLAKEAKRKAPDTWTNIAPPPESFFKFQKGNNKGKGKDNGKGKGKAKGLQGCKRKTKSGEKICFAFNKEGCRNRSCEFVHVCGICFKKDFPMWRCRHDREE